MEKNYTYEQLIEKIVEARIAAEWTPRKAHSLSCPIEDSESYAPCTCGASSTNTALDEVARKLRL